MILADVRLSHRIPQVNKLLGMLSAEYQFPADTFLKLFLQKEGVKLIDLYTLDRVCPVTSSPFCQYVAKLTLALYILPNFCCVGE